MKIPAVTIVAAWINAEIGVGPSIESGNQTCSGTCADLPIAPMKRNTAAKVMMFHSVPKNAIVAGASPNRSNASVYVNELVIYATQAIPIKNPKSPTRFTKNAFIFAYVAVGFLNQKPIKRYDTRPTASQPKKSCMKLLDITSINIEKVKSEI